MHPIPDGGLTLEEVIAWLQSGGYAAKVVTREDGKRHIESWSQGTLVQHLYARLPERALRVA